MGRAIAASVDRGELRRPPRASSTARTNTRASTPPAPPRAAPFRAFIAQLTFSQRPAAVNSVSPPFSHARAHEKLSFGHAVPRGCRTAPRDDAKWPDGMDRRASTTSGARWWPAAPPSRRARPAPKKPASSLALQLRHAVADADRAARASSPRARPRVARPSSGRARRGGPCWASRHGARRGHPSAAHGARLGPRALGRHRRGRGAGRWDAPVPGRGAGPHRVLL